MLTDEQVFCAGQRARAAGSEDHTYPLNYDLDQVRIWRAGWHEPAASN